MPGEDLGSIPGLQDKHRRVLANELTVTTCRALVAADRRDIHQAMRYLRPRPSLEQISRWQDEARSAVDEAAAREPDWQPAASFAIVFAQRRAGDGWERRLEAERTEVEPEQERRIWPGWDCGESCAWMRGQLSLAGAVPPVTAVPPLAEADPGDDAADVAVRPAHRTAGTAERARLRIDSATVVGRDARVDVLPAGTARADPLAGLTGPVRLEFTVSGGRHGHEIHVAARVLVAGAPGWNLRDPLVLKGPGRAGFDLAGLPPGQHDIRLAAWAPDGTAVPVAVSLTRLTVRQAAEPPGALPGPRMLSG
jgi:hypothetical protein